MGQGKWLQHCSLSCVRCKLMSVEGLPTGAGRSTNLLTIEKMVELAAMPRPMETTTASTKPGDLESRRNVYARSCRQAPMVFYPFQCRHHRTCAQSLFLCLPLRRRKTTLVSRSGFLLPNHLESIAKVERPEFAHSPSEPFGVCSPPDTTWQQNRLFELFVTLEAARVMTPHPARAGW